jgi:hypothetical protein
MPDPEIFAIAREQAAADRAHAAATRGMDLDDVALVAQHAKTYADGPVWEAACRLLGELED